MGRPGVDSEHPGPTATCAHSTCTLQGSPGPHGQGPGGRLGPRTGRTKEDKVTTPLTLGRKLPGGGGPRDGHDPGPSPRLNLALRPGSPGSAAAAPLSGGPRPPPAPTARSTVPVVNLGLAGGSCTDMGKVADAGEDCARDRGRCPPKDTGMPAASMDAW